MFRNIKEGIHFIQLRPNQNEVSVVRVAGRHHTLIYIIHRLGRVLGFNIYHFNISVNLKINIYETVSCF